MKTTFFLLLTFTATLAYSQSEKNIAIAPAMINQFYIGIDNPVDIAVSGIEYDELIVSVSNGVIRKTEYGNYIIRIKEGNKMMGSKSKPTRKAAIRNQVRIGRLATPMPTRMTVACCRTM